MRTMKIEKELLFPNQVKENMKLNVENSLTYHKETDGIRALGALYIQGAYRDEQDIVHEYNEALDMDILAPRHKLSEHDFLLDIQNYQAEVTTEGILLNIEMGIYGLIEQDVSQSEEENVMPEERKTADREDTQEPQETQFEDLFEDDEATFTSYRMVVARESDTYSTIARRYDVKEDELRNINHHKEVIPKSLLILPQH